MFLVRRVVVSVSVSGPVAPLADHRAVVLSPQFDFLLALLRTHACLVCFRPVALQ